MTTFTYYTILFPRLKETVHHKDTHRLTLSKGTNVFLTDCKELAEEIYRLFYINGGPCKNMIMVPDGDNPSNIHDRVRYKYAKHRTPDGITNKVISKWIN